MEDEFQIGDWRVRPSLNRIQGKTTVTLAPRTMQVLVHLASQAGRVCSKTELIDAIWGQAFVSEEVLTNAISKLRQALGDSVRDSHYIETVAKKGYRLIPPIATTGGPPQTGPLRLIKKLGESERSETLLVEDRSLKRLMVVKTLTQTSPQAQERLLRQAQAAAALEDPAICRIYQTGEWAGRPFVAMEHLQGRRLGDILREQVPNLQQTLSIASGIAQALKAAHQRGIIHRGLRPSKLMIDAQWQVKVMDFAWAKRLARPDNSDWSATFSLSGTTGGHPYMSPEQITGTPTPDGRSDLFSLGLILYQCLTGRHPFQRKSDMHLAVALVTEPLPPWLPQDDTPFHLRRLVEDLLAKEPDGRPASADEVLRRLRNDPAPPRPATAVSNGRSTWLKPLLWAVAVAAFAWLVWTILHRWSL